MKQENLFERAGIVWVVSEEVVFEIKGTLFGLPFNSNSK
jgi:hypothetical protein